LIADGEDLDKVLNQVKGLAKKAGIPADTIESWIASKGGKIDTDKLVSFFLLSSFLLLYTHHPAFSLPLPLLTLAYTRLYPPLSFSSRRRRVADCSPPSPLFLFPSPFVFYPQVKQVQSLASAGQATVEHFDTDKVVSSIKTVSPALASLLALTLQRSGVSLGNAGKDSAKGGKEQCEYPFLCSRSSGWVRRMREQRE